MNVQQRKENQIIGILNNSLVDLPTPISISFMWNVGFLLGIVLVTQIITGLVLSIHFLNECNHSFESVLIITRNVENGWILRFIHINSASLIFMLIFAHISRGLFFSSPHSNNMTWNSGILILLICMATAFLGYVLPWGQISFWGAAVITNIFSAIPYVGNSLVEWLWGNFSVSGPTLTRFFSLHFILPLAIVMVVMIHLLLLHNTGSSNPLGTVENMDNVNFSPPLINNDLISIISIMIIAIVTLLNLPIILGDVENFNNSNPLITPVHIQPEWYFLFAYAILRSIPSNLGGTLALVSSILILGGLGSSKNNNNNFSPSNNLIMWTTVLVFLLLTWVGINPVEPPFLNIGQITSALYFVVILTH